MDCYPKPMTKECTQKILKQIDNAIYTIKNKKSNSGIGYFCHIRYRKRNIPVLITTYEIINEAYLVNEHSINVSMNNEFITVEFGDIKYMNKAQDLTVIEIKEKKDKKINFLEIDEDLYNKKKELLYYNESMYIIHYNDQREKCVSYGVINNNNTLRLVLSCNSFKLPTI